MLKKFLREVVVIIVGKQAEEIADLLNTNKHVNEFIIAKKLNITINQARNILYKISDYGLVSFIRKKDKKKGWYTYFWKIEVLKSLEFLKSILLKKIAQISFQIKSRETKDFYVCERCNLELNEENALLQDFTCNECGAIFTIKDNSKFLRDLKRNLNRLEKELEFIEVEIVKEGEKVEKGKEKVRKKDEKEKGQKKVEAAEKRKIARAVTLKELGKGAKKKPLRGRSPTQSLRIKKVVKKTKKVVKKKVSKVKIPKKKVIRKKVIKKKVLKEVTEKKLPKKKIVKKKPLRGRSPTQSKSKISIRPSNTPNESLRIKKKTKKKR